MQEKSFITQDGMLKLLAELKSLKDNDRVDSIRAVSEGRSHGDLKENAEYHSAREQKLRVESKIALLERIVSNVMVFDPTTVADDGSIRFGSFVSVSHNNKIQEFRIVGEYESDATIGLLSINSPLGKVLLGKRVGDVVLLESPSGSREYIVNKVK